MRISRRLASEERQVGTFTHDATPLYFYKHVTRHSTAPAVPGPVEKRTQAADALWQDHALSQQIAMRSFQRNSPHQNLRAKNCGENDEVVRE